MCLRAEFVKHNLFLNPFILLVITTDTNTIEFAFVPARREGREHHLKLADFLLFHTPSHSDSFNCFTATMYSTNGTMPWQAPTGFSQPGGHAYIPVATRNPYASHLPPPPTYVPQPLNHAPAPTPASATEERKKIEWPPAVRDYVNRCFAKENELPGVGRPDMEKRLKEVITEAAKNNKLYTYEWTTMPLPQQMIADDRRRTALGTHALPSNFVPPPMPPVPMPFLPGVLPNAFQPVGSEVLRKRKSSELGAEANNNNSNPPWRVKKGAALEDRMSPSDKRPKFDHGPIPSKSQANLDQRKRRFDDSKGGSNSPRKATYSPTPSEPLGPVVGRCQKLEKNYFRLTSAPNPDDVRPLPILKQALEYVKEKWVRESNYVYVCDQLKALRQDLTVQHIKNDFTTNVYEIHARIALEEGDMGEYNQCQAQLRTLYRQNLGGHPTEFKAYRILYYIYTSNRTDMSNVLAELTPADKSSPAIKHALAIRSAIALGNYHQFFKLYHTTPNMGAYIIDKFLDRERIAALAVINKA